MKQNTESKETVITLSLEDAIKAKDYAEKCAYKSSINAANLQAQNTDLKVIVSELLEALNDCKKRISRYAMADAARWTNDTDKILNFGIEQTSTIKAAIDKANNIIK